MAIAGVGRAQQVETIANNVVIVIRTLTLAEEVAKELVLTTTPTDPNLVVLDLVNGTPQAPGTDFEVTGNVLSWDGKTLETVLTEGDVVRITYPL